MPQTEPESKKVRDSNLELFRILTMLIIVAYTRLYPHKVFQSNKICGVALLLSLVFSWASVIWGAWRYDVSNKAVWYNFVSDSNAIFALTTAIFAFCFFKNLNIRYSKIINTISASAFGVMLIHAASDSMRQWLWKDTLQNTTFFNSMKTKKITGEVS